ncbi:hypothetical protein [Streptomyces justiciae]|uniref:Uncharacterized protein n=1 Tax=Streptomyces justiciae TaxID=2780140 RepID=A0ABU3M713_9ACTN|nr:hypothetical protein [Streptomyces justiciae]MDT7847225.1 hypothetical protein [Streptomyces justiciae]
MFLDQPLAWTASHWPTIAAAAVLLIVLASLAAYIVHLTSGTVLAAGIGAIVCTGFSADTSWRFADHELHMTTGERAWLFAAGEVVLVVCAIMARANKIATATESGAGTPGVPGVMVWCIAGVQVIPAFTESGLVGGLVRAVFGPVMAALLWHLAMGLEIRVTRPEALSTGLPAQIGHELRERLLSHLGLATRNRTAEEITRDRAHARAVRLGARRHLGPWGRARLAAAVTRSRATADGTRRHSLMRDLAGRRTADQLRTMDVTSPWVPEPAAVQHPATPLGVTGAELRRMHPMDAITAMQHAHPDATVPELAALCTEYGVTVTEGQVRIALHPKAAQPDAHPQPPVLAVQPHPVPALPAPAPPPQKQAGDETDSFDSAAASALAIAQPGPAQPDATAAEAPATALVLDLAPMLPLQPGGCVADPAAAQPTQTEPEATRPPRRKLSAPPEVQELHTPDADAALLELARTINVTSLRKTGRKAPLRLLQSELSIGQRRAQRIQAQLPDSIPAADALPPAQREA